EGLAKTIKSDGRIHTTYLQNFVNTGRLSSRNPNLQNIPIRTKIGRELREIFVPQKDWTLIAADYSQIELRVMAHLANVKNLIQAFQDGRDIHTETGLKMFETDKISSLQRRQAKIINFSMIYGASPYGLADNLKVDIDTAKKFMKTYFELYPEIQNYMVEKEEEGKRKGFVETLFGRKCFVPLEHTRDAKFAARVSVNAPVQGTAADMMRLAMIRVQKFLEKEKLQTKMLLQIHDEIILESPENEKDFVIDSLRKIMENVSELNVPLKVDIGTGKNWNEAH
ncbi:MAG: DNA polymerase, partial [Alphaproteobacteria bacterium]